MKKWLTSSYIIQGSEPQASHKLTLAFLYYAYACLKSFYPHFTLTSPLFHSELYFRFMFSKYFLRILKICLPFKPYRIYEFKSEWKPFSKIGTIHYCKDWIRSSIQTIRISTGHHFTVFTVVIGFSILRSKITP